ncbi:uncharacterized protein K02A2.6-like [Armigeres subalbatus]|uniref:uncharacterized protein K02A2.6-like n=1 Tax=Armigeres subalbatus TaxID=124917 RepID=UPI002ED4EEEB
MVERKKTAETMSFKNKTNRIWFVKRAILGYTDNVNSLKREVEKQQHKPSISQQRDLAAEVTAIDRSLRKKTSRKDVSHPKSSPHSLPVPWPKTTGPWKRVHVDYAGPFDGEYFLLAVDAYSKWPKIIPTRSITSTVTIILRSLFARFGMPEVIVSDNGTQFTSVDFQKFCADNDIDRITTAPYHPQSNGQAERFVDTFKRSVKKIQEGKRTLHEALDIFLLVYRSTPNRQVVDGKSPSESIFGRRIHTNLDLLRPPSSESTILPKPDNEG